MQTNNRNILSEVTVFVTELCVMGFRFIKRTTHKRMQSLTSELNTMQYYYVDVPFCESWEKAEYYNTEKKSCFYVSTT